MTVVRRRYGRSAKSSFARTRRRRRRRIPHLKHSAVIARVSLLPFRSFALIRKQMGSVERRRRVNVRECACCLASAEHLRKHIGDRRITEAAHARSVCSESRSVIYLILLIVSAIPERAIVRARVCVRVRHVRRQTIYTCELMYNRPRPCIHSCATERKHERFSRINFDARK